MKILDSIWFTPGYLNIVGIVKIETEPTKEIKYYIGSGEGDSIKDDELLIAEVGAPFPKHAGDKLFGE